MQFGFLHLVSIMLFFLPNLSTLFIYTAETNTVGSFNKDEKGVYTDLSVIFNPVGDDRFKPLSTGAIHPFPSILASASCKKKRKKEKKCSLIRT